MAGCLDNYNRLLHAAVRLIVAADHAFSRTDFAQVEKADLKEAACEIRDSMNILNMRDQDLLDSAEDN